MTHTCASKLTIIGSDNGLSPDRRQAIIWTNAGMLLIGPLWTSCSAILIEIRLFSFKKTHLKMSYGKWWPFWFCLGLSVLIGGIWMTCAVWFDTYTDKTQLRYALFKRIITIYFSHIKVVIHGVAFPCESFHFGLLNKRSRNMVRATESLCTQE